MRLVSARSAGRSCQRAPGRADRVLPGSPCQSSCPAASAAGRQRHRRRAPQNAAADSVRQRTIVSEPSASMTTDEQQWRGPPKPTSPFSRCWKMSTPPCASMSSSDSTLANVAASWKALWTRATSGRCLEGLRVTAVSAHLSGRVGEVGIRTGLQDVTHELRVAGRGGRERCGG
jgi:hypothetical protein